MPAPPDNPAGVSIPSSSFNPPRIKSVPPETPEETSRIIQPPEGEKEDKKYPEFLPWTWALLIFALIALAYIVMDAQGISANETTRFWALVISGIGAIAATLYHYWRKTT